MKQSLSLKPKKPPPDCEIRCITQYVATALGCAIILGILACQRPLICLANQAWLLSSSLSNSPALPQSIQHNTTAAIKHAFRQVRKTSATPAERRGGMKMLRCGLI